MRMVVASAYGNQLLQRCFHLDNFSEFLFQICKMTLGNRFDLPTGTARVTPLADQFRNLSHREAQTARLPDAPATTGRAALILARAACGLAVCNACRAAR